MGFTNKLTAIADAIREKTGSTALLTLDQMAQKIEEFSNSLFEDVPTTQGQWACLSRASQMRDIKYTPKVNMYASDESSIMYAGTEYTGIVYSSVRALDWGFIGYPISMYSYLTALNNPKSVIYTKKYMDYFPNESTSAQVNVYNVYGTNCSEYVSYCLDLPYLLTTVRLWNDFPLLVGTDGVYEKNGYRAGKCYDVDTQSVNTTLLQTELKLCDVMVCTSHTVMVTGIRRDVKGLIQEVDISESWVPRIRKRTYSWNEFIQQYIEDEGYQVFEYSRLDSVTFPENLTNIVYSDIVTNRGDKVSIRPNQDIALNVLGNGYEGIALFKDGVQVAKQENTNDWDLTNLATGKYTAILYKSGETVTIEDANETNSTSFIVCNVSLSRDGNTYRYTAEAINGVYPKPMQITFKTEIGMTDQYEVIEGDNFAGIGSIEVTPRETPSIIHVPFKTEYGFVIAECKF